MKTFTLQEIRLKLYSAVVCDALDSLGHRQQSPQVPMVPYVHPNGDILVGRCKTTLWADMAHEDPKPYELELKAVDSCSPDSVFVAAANGSLRSGIWGELLTTAAQNAGCLGAVIDGAVRDVGKIRAMNFPLFARGTSPYDSMNRQRVVDLDVEVEVGGTKISPDDLLIADEDGIVIVPSAVESEVLALAWEKVHGENITREAIKNGMKATDAYKKFGVL